MPGPIAAIAGPASARASRAISSSRRAPFGLVTQSRSNDARSAGSAASSGSMRIAGASTTWAPSAMSRAASALACARARVTATLSPRSGPAANHASSSCRAATGPTTVIAGARTPACKARAAMSASVPVTVRWSANVPRSITATGSLPGRPPATSCSAIRGSLRTPM